jgi:hypothetical protein
VTQATGLDLRVGVDVGETNTDSVVIDGAGRCLATAKAPTTTDVQRGIARSLARLLQDATLDPRRVTHCMIGTTSIAQAITRPDELEPVAALRIGAPATRALVPFASWPRDLADSISVGARIVGGGAEIDGSEFAPLAADDIRRFAEEVGGSARGIAISAVFSPAAPAHERRAAALVRDVLGQEVHISLSHELGHLGLLERENTTILNAALAAVARDLVAGLQATLDQLHLDPVVFFCQNDGTVMTLEHAQRYPVLTVGSRVASSMRGAAVLAGIDDAVVIDVGGSTTILGELVAGFPRERDDSGGLGGVPASFRMPDSMSLGIGGDTRLLATGDGVELGHPSSAPAAATLLDAAAAAGRSGVRASRSTARSRRSVLADGLDAWDEQIAHALQRTKLDSEPQPLIAVGGAAALVPDGLPGVSETLRPRHADVAGAVGAAAGTVSGHVDRLYPAGTPRDRILAEVRQEVTDQTIQAGGDPARVHVVEIQEVALGYLPSPAIRVRSKAVAPI